MDGKVKAVAILAAIALSIYLAKAQIIRNPTVPGFHVVNTTYYSHHYSTKDPFINLLLNVRLADILFYTTLLSLMLSALTNNIVVRRVVLVLAASILPVMLVSDVLFGNPFINLPKLYVHPFRGRSIIDLGLSRDMEVRVLNCFLLYYLLATAVFTFSIIYVLLRIKLARRDVKLLKQLIPIPAVTLLCSIAPFSPVIFDVAVLYLALLSTLIVFTTITLSCR